MKMKSFLTFSLLLSTLLAVSALAQTPLGSLESLPYVEGREQESEAVGDGIDEIGRNGVDSGMGMLDTGMGLFDDFRDFAESAGALNIDDLEFDPDYSPPGTPTIPVHCDVSGGDNCRQCYDSAYRKLNFVRHYLEKLRAIYGATQKYTQRAISFGDSMAGLHGGFGMAWPVERRGIEEAFEHMGGTYDEKYQAYMRELLEGLQDLANCEKQYFGEDDWYNRYGFIYYTYMQDRYRR